jgi:hypothetical protein
MYYTGLAIEVESTLPANPGESHRGQSTGAESWLNCAIQ